MLNDDLKTKELILIVADPDKNFQFTNENPLGWSVPSEIEISLDGEYHTIGFNTENISLSYDKVNKVSKATFVVKDGLSSEITLQENNK